MRRICIMRQPDSSCCGTAGMVQRFMGDSAYDIVKYVAENMEYIKFMFETMSRDKILYCVNSTEELEKTNINVTQFARVYVLKSELGTQYIDYIYLKDVSSGIRPVGQPNATGSWLPVSSSFVNTTHPAYGPIPWLYKVKNHNQREFQIDRDAAGVKEIYIRGVRQHLNEDFWYDPLSRKITTKVGMQPNEQVVCMLVGIPAIPGRDEAVDGYSMMTWIFNAKNGGRAVGDGTERIITIDLPYNNITNIYLNGKRLAHELDLECKVLPQRDGIQLYEPLKEGDILAVQIGGYFGNRVDALITIDTTVTESTVECGVGRNS